MKKMKKRFTTTIDRHVLFNYFPLYVFLRQYLPDLLKAYAEDIEVEAESSKGYSWFGNNGLKKKSMAKK